MVVKQQVMSADTFWTFLQTRSVEQRLELIEGEIQEMAPAGEEHGIIAGNLFGHIWHFVNQNKLGRVTAAETGYRVHENPDGRDTVLAPDVGFTGKERLPDAISSKFAPYAPDLAVEVVSPGDRADKVQEKVSLYLQYGTSIVLVVYPKTKEIVVHRKDGATTLSQDGKISNLSVLPGFELALEDIFTR